MAMRNKKENGLREELEKIHPNFHKYVGSSGFEVPKWKMDQFREKQSNQNAENRNRVMPHRKITKIAAVAALFLLFSTLAAMYFNRQQSNVEYAELGDFETELYYNYLMEEGNQIPDELLFEMLGEIYLESFDGIENSDLLYYETDDINTFYIYD